MIDAGNAPEQALALALRLAALVALALLAGAALAWGLLP